MLCPFCLLYSINNFLLLAHSAYKRLFICFAICHSNHWELFLEKQTTKIMSTEWVKISSWYTMSTDLVTLGATHSESSAGKLRVNVKCGLHNSMHAVYFGVTSVHIHCMNETFWEKSRNLNHEKPCFIMRINTRICKKIAEFFVHNA